MDNAPCLYRRYCYYTVLAAKGQGQRHTIWRDVSIPEPWKWEKDKCEFSFENGVGGEAVASFKTSDIGADGKITATCAARDGYYFARLDYVLSGEARSIKTEVVRYSSDGKRVKNG